MADVPYIWWRGVRCTPAGRDAVLAAEQRAGFRFTITQGGFNAGGVAASAGTHDQEAFDFSVRGLTREQVAAMIEALRWAGFAAWFRTTSVGKWGTSAHGFGSYHVHAVSNGWGLMSAGARAQVRAYRAGRDGLRGNLADTGPGHVKTWYGQRSPRKPSATGSTPTLSTPTQSTPQEDDMTPDQSAKLDAIFSAVAERDGIERAGESAARQTLNHPVHRGGKPVALIQEIADAKSNTILLLGQIAGLTKALESIAAGKGVDLAAVEAASERGARAALSDVQATITLKAGQ